ncbi:MAG TPA: cyclic nucleotide-binding domain-containing protein [Acidimicrobiia bacterium]|nr:cyclic nucleotide-binding domain-containing protein [Acidimicrobiia bacterium]HMC79599.1 cyclic nucleotide-binding domain-containing protein [Acidimicrobiia bacterium]
MGRRDAYIEHLTQVPLFSACSRDELQKLAKRTTDIPIAEGHVLVKEGDRGLEFFVIVSGLAKVSRRGRKVGELGPGDFFGELALLIDSNRNATVTALTPMEAIVLSRREFEAALADAPRMTRKIMAGMARRLAEFDSKF